MPGALELSPTVMIVVVLNNRADLVSDTCLLIPPPDISCSLVVLAAWLSTLIDHSISFVLRFTPVYFQ